MFFEFEIPSTAREQMIDVTEKLNEALARSGAQNGLAVAFVPHTTSALTINENADPAVRRDLLQSLRGLVPERGDYLHAEGNSDAHLKASLFGSSVTVLVVDGRLKLGTWQSVFYCEFDGPRRRKLWVQILKGDA